MNVQDAIRTAKTFVLETMADEQIFDLGLEEIEFEDEVQLWRVTIGFARPWQKATQNLSRYASNPREYRALEITANGDVRSMKMRFPEDD